MPASRNQTQLPNASDVHSMVAQNIEEILDRLGLNPIGR